MRRLCIIDVPRPANTFRAIVGKYPMGDDNEPWFRFLRMWSEIDDISETESFGIYPFLFLKPSHELIQLSRRSKKKSSRAHSKYSAIPRHSFHLQHTQKPLPKQASFTFRRGPLSIMGFLGHAFPSCPRDQPYSPVSAVLPIAHHDTIEFQRTRIDYISP